MKTKLFSAATMQQALKQVREEIGADAVILSSRKVETGVEIVATLDYDEHQTRERFETAVKKASPEEKLTPGRLGQLQADHHRRMADALANSRQRISEVKGRAGVNSGVRGNATEASPKVGVPPTLTAAKPGAGGDAIEQMRAEIFSLKEMLQQQMGQSSSVQAREASLVQQRLEEKLLDFGLEPALAKEQSVAGAKAGNLDEGWRQSMRWLSTTVRMADGDVVAGGGVFALLGPTGAGKTTTIGKLAAAYVLNHGADNIALVTTDRYRVAGHEQLFVFGRILNIPVRVVDEHHSLDSVLNDLSAKRVVLIDTAGLTPADRGFQQQLTELRQSRHRIRHLLVTASTSQTQVMRATWQSYRAVPLQGVVITKVDEAITLGEALSFMVRCGLPVAYWTNGQKIPDDLHKATLAGLLKYALRGAAPDGAEVARHEKRA